MTIDSTVCLQSPCYPYAIPMLSLCYPCAITMRVLPRAWSLHGPFAFPFIRARPPYKSSSAPCSPRVVWCIQVEAFDQGAFLKTLANRLGSGITPADLTLVVTPGSIIIIASLTTKNPDLAQSAVAGFHNIAQNTSLAALSADLGVQISTKALAPLEQFTRDQKAVATGPWVLVVAVFASFAALAACYCTRARRRDNLKLLANLDSAIVVRRDADLHGNL